VSVPLGRILRGLEAREVCFMGEASRPRWLRQEKEPLPKRIFMCGRANLIVVQAALQCFDD